MEAIPSPHDPLITCGGTDRSSRLDDEPASAPTEIARRDSLFDDDDHGVVGKFPLPAIDDISSRLLSLPADLLLELLQHLSPASTISLRMTCRALNRTFAPPKQPVHREMCTKTAIASYKDELADSRDGRHRCALCKALYGDDTFRRAAILDPAMAFANFASPTAPPIIETEESSQILIKPAEKTATTIPSPRICAWHVNRFIFPPTAALAPDAIFDSLVSAASGSPTPDDLEGLKLRASASGWASSIEQACMHCGHIVVCVCTIGSCGRCLCENDCSSCGIRDVRCWWKLARNGLGPRQERPFKLARQNWLIARAEEQTRYGWDGRGLSAQGLLDWGMVRVVKCAHTTTTTTDAVKPAVPSKKRVADFD